MGQTLDKVRAMIREAEEAHEGTTCRHIELPYHTYADLVCECEPRSPAEVLGVAIDVMGEEEPPARGTLH